jgi:hypothetical protein
MQIAKKPCSRAAAVTVVGLPYHRPIVDPGQPRRRFLLEHPAVPLSDDFIYFLGSYLIQIDTQTMQGVNSPWSSRRRCLDTSAGSSP